MRATNPILQETVFRRQPSLVEAGTETMSVQGTIHKTITLLALCFIASMGSWTYLASGSASPASYWVFIGGGLIGALVTSIWARMSPQKSGILAPIFGVCEGLVLGSFSIFFERMYPGIVFQAVILTFGLMFTLLFAYRMKWIKVTKRFQAVAMGIMGAVGITYLVSIVLGFFGTTIPLIHTGHPIGIAFSGLALFGGSMMLVMEFDFIEGASQQRLPKYMEWLGAIGLLATLVFLYIEMLKLLAKLNRR